MVEFLPLPYLVPTVCFELSHSFMLSLSHSLTYLIPKENRTMASRKEEEKPRVEGIKSYETEWNRR